MSQVKSEFEPEAQSRIFTVDLAAIKPKNEDRRLTTIFSKMDKHFIRKHYNKKEMLRTYRDIPLALERLYKESDYIKSRHGRDLQITIDPRVTSKKKRRQVTLVQDSFSTDEEQVFLKLHQEFTALTKEYPGKSIYDLTDIFLKVSGDLQALRDYLAGKKVCTWTYLQDLALSSQDTSKDFRTVLGEKGRDEIEKRKKFLLKVNQQANENETLASKSALKRSLVSSQVSGSVVKESGEDMPIIPGTPQSGKVSEVKEEKKEDEEMEQS